ncbi:NAD(P)H-hydrate dehydratase [Candidatus Peregrinibacteria bacterium]|nr:NAD(P)H-hydrate dehydratase [Candidatus Peregrinibacteria bacterium]
MPEKVTQNMVKDKLPQRKSQSHKGEHGRVLVIGGSREYFGAPILTALGALNSGCDLVYLFVPECNFDVTRSYSPNFIVKSYQGDFLHKKILPSILEISEMCDTIVIGPGLGKISASYGGRSDIPSLVASIFQKIRKAFVLDAEAILACELGDFNDIDIVITPHAGEFLRLTGQKLSYDLSERAEQSHRAAMQKGVSILLKGPTDVIASRTGEIFLNSTGNPGMTVGGTGDVLAGITGGLIAQGLSSFDGACCASYINGACGDALYKKKWFAFNAEDIALEIPFMLRELMG